MCHFKQTAKPRKATFYASDSTVEESVALVVHLIKAARLPPRHADLQASCATVLESEKEALNDKGSVIKDAVVEPNENRYVTLAIHNCSLQIIRLEEGHILECL